MLQKIQHFFNKIRQSRFLLIIYLIMGGFIGFFIGRLFVPELKVIPYLILAIISGFISYSYVKSKNNKNSQV